MRLRDFAVSLSSDSFTFCAGVRRARYSASGMDSSSAWSSVALIPSTSRSAISDSSLANVATASVVRWPCAGDPRSASAGRNDSNRRRCACPHTRARPSRHCGASWSARATCSWSSQSRPLTCTASSCAIQPSASRKRCPSLRSRVANSGSASRSIVCANAKRATTGARVARTARSASRWARRSSSMLRTFERSLTAAGAANPTAANASACARAIAADSDADRNSDSVLPAVAASLGASSGWPSASKACRIDCHARAASMRVCSSPRKPGVNPAAARSGHTSGNASRTAARVRHHRGEKNRTKRPA